MTKTKERSIISNAAEVIGILAGTKTQVRSSVNGENYCNYHDYNGQWVLRDDGLWWYESVHGCADNGLKCPYGKIGDELWVRETFAVVKKHGFNQKEDLPLFEYTHFSLGEPDRIDDEHNLIYKADREIHPNHPVRFRSSVHMPRWASRIQLKIVGVQVERIQEVSTEDIIAEGVYSEFVAGNSTLRSIEMWVAPGVIMTSQSGEKDDYAACHTSPQAAFMHMWNKKVKRWDGWDSNPWVWKITFEVIK